MGLSSFPSSAEGALPVIIMNSVGVMKDVVRSALQVVIASLHQTQRETRRISTTHYFRATTTTTECCVCLCRFQADEELSQLSCNHFFHKPCLDKWFLVDSQRATCPLCRSIH